MVATLLLTPIPLQNPCLNLPDRILKGLWVPTNCLEVICPVDLSRLVLALVALENSDIIANARQSFGGRVSINAQGIFGTQFRDNSTLLSDITATGEVLS